MQPQTKSVRDQGIDKRLAEPNADRYFTEEAFDLLAQLRENPTKEVYLSQKGEFQCFLRDPFKELFADISRQLPQDVTKHLETEKNILSRILKNDYGRGGAYDYYWGAFYTKGSNRRSAAQLFIKLHVDMLEFGFSVGEYGQSTREKLWQRIRENQEAVARALDGASPRDQVRFGSKEDWTGSFETWLQQPQPELRASAILTSKEVLSCSKTELTQRIGDVFVALFPLFQLAISDKPLLPLPQTVMETDGGETVPELQPPYTLAQCAQDTGLAVNILESWKRALERKKQAILYGPPGTGKTYVAQHLARHLVSDNDGFWEVIQFHPAYAYEDFIQGIRPQPDEEGRLAYPVVPGRFLQFCARALEHTGTCVLIIDEINRANLARVFGELMFLLEYRDGQVPLAADGGLFGIPANVRILGTMNTADRSIALVDHALRRRFAFIELQPNYEVLRAWHEQHSGFLVEGLVGVLQQVNSRIDDRNYSVGISFFLKKDLREHLEDIWQMEIVPYLEEYFFDQASVVEEFTWAKIADKVMPAP